MPDTRVPKQLLYSELSSGKRKTCGQWKRYKDQLKANLKKFELELQWENRADDRACWRRTSRMGVANLEQRRITMEAQKRAAKEPRKWQRHCRQYIMFVQCVWSNMSISNRPLQPPAHSSSINLLIIILDDSDHHTRSRGIARERES